MKTHHIHFNGIVQGVGFRPMVYSLATEMGICGNVSNGNDGVNIFFNADDEKANDFFERLKSAFPATANIIAAGLKKAKPRNFKGFSIVLDEGDTEKKVLLSPDIALCENCRAELNDEENRRYRYPFITCTQCGPRYSIIKTLPYERHGTTMAPFTMCKSCDEEYHDVLDRRFFSQTNSCDDCGIKLKLHYSATAILSEDTEKVLFHIKNFLLQGTILAIKGIGGYLLLCDANHQPAVQTMRHRKLRPTKPLAVLYPNIAAVEHCFELKARERELLQSPEAPIVLLYPKKQAEQNLAIDDIAPGLTRVGVMLPYSPLLELIAQDFRKPLIATSANISGSPIIYRDGEAIEHLFDIASHVVSYNREITLPQDDSVVQISKHNHQQIILRRSRGYAPSFINYKPVSGQCLLSTGAFLKSSFTLAVNGNVFVSQFLGSGESYESQLMYRQTLEHWLQMYAAKPDVLIADMHTNYFSRQYADELAQKLGANLVLVQHHRAHFAAILAEHKLLQADQPVLGVIWDGTGLGDDSDIWGGEFFTYAGNHMQRSGHFDYIPLIAGDKTALEPRIAALCACYNVSPLADELKEKFTEAEWNVYHILIQNTGIVTSSVGRIFDAVASLLDLCDKQTYEGEAAMYLQSLAESYVAEHGFVMDTSYFEDAVDIYRVPTAELIQGILIDLKNGRQKDYIAAKFHYSLVGVIDSVAAGHGIEKICFSGGVFQNALLVDWIKKEYESKYSLHFHIDLSPNDENISFGQMVYYEHKIGIRPDTITNKQFAGEVLSKVATFTTLHDQTI
ncbi:carbamoyltransferase HypF [uncultured Mucilaginibacter sp.]|uniref:carbamoyltransferase HypF n=1 Tax=uncultured Mucilaginibacter sp. TaxID=797541 RepID=UPI0025E717B5|nr:carbamoyltransferase HypF [uncultured Mucilaginibacter sp.]